MYFRWDSYHLKHECPVRIMGLLFRASLRVMLASTLFTSGIFQTTLALNLYAYLIVRFQSLELASHPKVSTLTLNVNLAF